MMQKKDTSNLSQIVCSSELVREAFALHQPLNAWWRVILALHGKPVQASLSPQQKTTRVADGFRFYASLYRGLGLLFLLLSPILITLPITETGTSYFAIASLLAGLYLWFVSGFGYVGANSYRAGERRGNVALISFMVMIVAFLSLFVTATSLIVQQMSPSTLAFNLTISGALFIFGIGSYLIEIVYLATE